MQAEKAHATMDSMHMLLTCSSTGICAAVQLAILELDVSQLTIAIEDEAEVLEP